MITICNTQVPVGFEVTELDDGRVLVLGIVALFSTHVARINDIQELAEICGMFPIDPCRIPDEEGYQRMRDLPDLMWRELKIRIAELRARP